jgi:hypothetical protein
MTEPPSAQPAAAKPTAPPVPPPVEAALPLDYANPWPDPIAPSSEAILLFWWGVRRTILAGGFGLTAWGLATLATSHKPYTAAFALGWGVFFLVLMLPKRWRLHRPQRRRRRRAVAPARRSGI